MKFRYLLSLLALAAQPALAAPMTQTEFDRVFAGLQNDTVLTCLSRQRLQQLSPDAQLDACIAAVNDIEGALKRLDHPSPAVEGVYLYADIAAVARFITTISQVDGGLSSRVCRASGQQMVAVRLVDLTAYDPAMAANYGEMLESARQLDQQCRASYPANY